MSVKEYKPKKPGATYTEESCYIIEDSGERKEFDTGAVRDTEKNKPRFDLIPPHALKRVADVYARGALKYGENNWIKGMPFTRFLSSGMRHIEAWRRGERNEDHLAQAIFNLLALIEFEELNRNDLNDIIKYDVYKQKT